jgi:hypothetical protein
LSKPVVKVSKKNELGHSQAFQKSQHPSPALREVNVPVVAPENLNNVVAVYKDLNQPAKDFALTQRKQLLFGVVVFAVLALGILMGQHFSKPRGVAGVVGVELSKMIPAGVEETHSEHYHYDKSCYIGENGEQVCMTRTSK